MSSEPNPALTKQEQLETLRLTYERTCGERDRLRDARGLFSRALGPAPASAGISTALVATFAHTRSTVLLALALAALALLVLVGVLYGGKPAYRHLYADRIQQLRDQLASTTPAPSPAGTARLGSYFQQEARTEDALHPADWYTAMIDLERRIYGREQTGNHYLLPWKPVSTLQQGLDSERTGLWIVQGLWLLVIVLLVASVLV